MTSSTHYDLIVIGFGKAGKTIAMEAGNAGKKVALVERDPGMYGGTCINIACVPTKTLISATQRGLDWHSAVGTRDELIETLNATNLTLAEDAHVTVFTAEAAFTGERTVALSARDAADLTLTGDKIVINTGAEVNKPDLPGIDGPRIHDFVSIQHISPRPERLTIVGGGPVGLEFAGLFAEQGTQVTLIDGSDRALASFDADVAESAQKVLEDQGVSFLTGARAQSFDDDGSTLTVGYTLADDTQQSVQADAVLLATGRHPATEGLGLEAAGVELRERGEVVVDKQLRTSAENVWAVGDVNGGPQQTYVSYDDSRVLSSQFSGDGTYTTEGRLLPTTTFITPPLSVIGMSEQEAEDSGRKIEIRSKNIADMPIVPRPKIVAQPEGMAKFILDAETNEILGATLFSVDSQELINTVALAMRHGITAAQLGDGIYTHPSTSEIFNQLLA